MIRSKIQLLFNVLIVFSFLKPAGFDLLGYGTVNSLVNGLRIVAAAYVMLVYFKSCKLSKPVLCIMGFFVLAAVSTILTGSTSFFKFVIFAISMIAMYMYIEYMSKQNARLMIMSFVIVYIVLMFANYVWMIKIGGFVIDVESTRPDLFKPGTKYVISILNSVNGVASYVFPSVIFAVLLMLITHKKNLLGWSLIAICFMSELFLWSATSLLGVFLAVVYIFLIYGKNGFERLIPMKIVIYLIVLLSIGITFFHIHYLFSFIIVDILHKDLSMTGRLPQWVYVMGRYFYPSPIIGSGWATRTADNCYVQVLCDMGIVGFSYFMIMLNKFLRWGNAQKPSSLERFLLVMLAIEIIMFSSESWVQFYGFYITLALIANARAIVKSISTFARV